MLIRRLSKTAPRLSLKVDHQPKALLQVCSRAAAPLLHPTMKYSDSDLSLSIETFRSPLSFSLYNLKTLKTSRAVQRPLATASAHSISSLFLIIVCVTWKQLSGLCIFMKPDSEGWWGPYLQSVAAFRNMGQWIWEPRQFEGDVENLLVEDGWHCCHYSHARAQSLFPRSASPHPVEVQNRTCSKRYGDGPSKL